MPSLPTAVMPVTSKVGRVYRHSDHMTKPRRKIAITPRAKIGLRRLVGLNPPYLESVLRCQVKQSSSYPKKPQTTRVEAIKVATSTNT